MLKIGIMGGTFNPVHNGHIAVAKAACSQFGLDKVLFITGGNPPHKKKQVILDKCARHKMVTLAIKGEEKFEACDYEIKKDEYSYTFETLRYLKKQYKGAKLYFIIGADSLHDILTWKNPRMIMEMCTLLVYDRTGYDREKDLAELKKDYFCQVDFIKSEKIDVSSSQIREKIANEEDVKEYICPQVHEYIKRNNIYKIDNRPLKRKLREVLTVERYVHSVGVSISTVSLAGHYGINENKAYVAGLLHDCAKNYSPEVMKQKCEDYCVELDEHEIENPFLIHAKVGAKVASIEYGVRDKEVLEAIECHTVGKVGMGMLSKIVFLADMIEPERQFPGVDIIRKKAFEDIDEAIKICIQTTIDYNTKKQRPIHPVAYQMLDWLSKK